jgi:hypothetical protein
MTRQLEQLRQERDSLMLQAHDLQRLLQESKQQQPTNKRVSNDRENGQLSELQKQLREATKQLQEKEQELEDVNEQFQRKEELVCACYLFVYTSYSYFIYLSFSLSLSL